ncbi:Hydroxymethylglutaryl-CoA lyase [plant metagenome]
MSEQKNPLPLAGIRVVEFTHMVMGPSCGMLLADLGAEVIKVEPVNGDNTRRLPGSGSGFYAMFNRNKKSLAVDVKQPAGREAVLRLLATADVFSENFKPGTMEKLGLGYEALSKLNPRLIYVSHKGFLKGPYDQRTALDEVVQMMGGMAYMTGPEGRPLRAGASVNDIMGGIFGAIGAMAALRTRDTTGRGQQVESSLFENNVFLMGTHMMQYAVTGKPAKPMPSRVAAWAVYDVFEARDGGQIFLGVVSDTQWRLFCDAFGLAALKASPRLATNPQRVAEREWLMPQLRAVMATYSAEEISTRFEAHGLPFAPITQPHELFEDEHLRESGGLAPVHIAPDASGAQAHLDTRTPLLPLMLDGERLGVRSNPPSIGEHTAALLRELGYSADEIKALESQQIIHDGEG